MRVWIAGLATAGLLATGAFAQDDQPMNQGPPPGANSETRTTTTTTWTIQPQQRTVIHDYIVNQNPRPPVVNEAVTIGAPVPPDVALQPVPEEIYTSVPEARHYEYFDWDGRMVFVDPDTNRVVKIVD